MPRCTCLVGQENYDYKDANFSMFEWAEMDNWRTLGYSIGVALEMESMCQQQPDEVCKVTLIKMVWSVMKVVEWVPDSNSK